jgi:LmbE family N-acetylglucosaminyl deacetylase
MERLGTVLGVWAHPDDEAYLSAGLMARAVDAGDRVVCVTATRGEEGSFDEERWPPAKMAAVREAELLACLEVIGVGDHRWLDMRDGTLAEEDADAAVHRLSAIVEEVAPDTVLTFGPDGMTGHPDHKAVCAWTTRAFERSAPAGSRLCYATYTPEWSERFVETYNTVNAFMEPGTPPVTPAGDLEICVRLSPEELERKIRALERHVSQIEPMTDLLGRQLLFDSQDGEYYRLAERKAPA